MARTRCRTSTYAMLVAGALLAPAPMAAQQDTLRADTTIYRLEGLSISAIRPFTTIGGASARVVSVEALDLPPAPTAEEIFRQIEGIHVRTNSRGQAEVSVRGSESRQVAVLVDGVPLTLGWDGRTDISVLPAGAVREVSFVRGLSSLLHGPNVLGGVVEMNVARGNAFPVDPSLEVSAGLDHVGGYSTAAHGALPLEIGSGRGMIRAGAGFRKRPGEPLANGVSEPTRPNGDLRLNTDFDNLDGFLAFRYASEEGAWSGLSAATHEAERGVAAELGADQPRLWRYPRIARTIVAVSGGTGDRATPLGRGDLEASVGLDVGKTRIRSFTDRTYGVLAGAEDGDDRTVTLRLLGDHTLGSGADLRASLTYADIEHDATLDSVRSKYEQHLFSAGAETIWRLFDSPESIVQGLRVSFGGVYDRGTTPRTGGFEPLGTIHDWGARIGLSAPLSGGDALVHFGVSRRGRFPALRETYSEALDRFVPNPDLRPEHLIAGEAGVTARVGTGELQLVGFHQELRGVIRRIGFPDGTRMRVNSEELRSTGVELMVSQTFGPLEVGGDLTLQSVELNDPATSFTARPENVPERSGRAFARFPLPAGIFASTEAAYTGTQFCLHPDTGADVELDGGTWLSGALSRIWLIPARTGIARRLETRVSLDNLTDTALYDQCGLPRHGTLLRFQVRVF